MRTLKIYWLRASAAVLTLVLGFFVVVGAMDKGEEARVTGSTQPSEVPYYYTGPETSDITILQDLNNWSTNQNPEHTCGDESDVPCFIMAASPASLNSKLQAASDLSDVLEESPSRRENQ